MSEGPNKDYRKIVCLSFPADITKRPVVCNLSRLYDLCFNILKAQIDPRQEGHMTLEISGLEADYHRGIQYLKEFGVKVSSAARQINRDDQSCMHCGLCTAMCTTKALRVDLETRQVMFFPEECSACGLCTRVCPVRAMTEERENGL
jgi:ferredoxin